MRLSRSAEASGPIGAVIEVDSSRVADDGLVEIRLSGDVDMFSVPRVRSSLADHVGRCNVLVDLSGVRHLDSSALRVFVEAQRRSAAAGHVLELTRPREVVRRLFAVSGLRGVLRVTA